VRLLVLGASGATGQLLVSAALARGHTVTALVRDTVRLSQTHKRLRVVTGSAIDVDQLEPAMAEQDAVVSALGTRARGGRVEIYSASTRAALEAMARCGVRRIVVLSAAGVPGLNVAVPPFFSRVVIPLLARAEYADMARMEALLAQSDAEWTALRPLWLRNGPALGGVRLSDKPFAPTSWGIRREDLASALLQLAEQGTFVREGVWVGY
jgi:putative NADH-flavin reductase